MSNAAEEQKLNERVKALKGAELIQFSKLVNEKLKANLDEIKKTMAEEPDEEKRAEYKKTIKETLAKLQKSLKEAPKNL